MEVEGINIVIGEVDKYVSAIQQAESAQAIVKQFIEYLAKCQRKLKGKDDESEALSQELNNAARKIVMTIAKSGPNPQLILALTEIITYFSVLTVSWLLELVKSLSSVTDDNARQTAIVLVLVAIAKSGKVSELVQSNNKSSLKQISVMTKHFATIVKESLLEDIAYEGLAQLLDQLQNNTKLFNDYVLPSVTDLLSAKWHFNTLVFALQIADRFKDVDLSKSCTQLKEKSIVSPTHLNLFSTMFSQYIPSLDNNFWALVQNRLQQLPNEQMVEFVGGIWKTVAGTLASKKKDAKLLSLFNWLWDLDEAVHSSLLTDPLFVVLKRQLHAKQKESEVEPVLQKLTQTTLKDQTLAVTILCGYPELATSLPEKVISDASAQFVAHFYDQPHNSLLIAQSLAQMARDMTNAAFTEEVTKFLFFHGFFTSIPTTGKTKALPTVLGAPLRVGKPAKESSPAGLSSAVRSQVQLQFFRLLTHTTVGGKSTEPSKTTKPKTKKTKEQKDDTPQRNISTLYYAIVAFHRQLVKFSDQIELRKPLEDDCDQALTSAATTAELVSKQLKTEADNSKRDELDAFLLLLSMSYVMQVTDPLEAPDNLTDLVQCYNDIFGSAKPTTKKRKAGDDNSSNKDKGLAVLVDIIISLQTKPLYLVATLPQYIIKRFSKALTSEAIEGILKAVTQPSLNKTDADDDDDDEDDELDGEEEDEDNEDAENDANGAGAESEGSDGSESDILLDDMHDEALTALDGVIASIMKKSQKPKIKQTGSQKDPDLEFRERVASLLFSYTKKAQTGALLELLPALLKAISTLQIQTSKQNKDATEASTESAEPSEQQQKALRTTQFYKSVAVRLTEVVKDICHHRSGLAQQLTTAQKEALFAKLIPFCAINQGEDISKLASDTLFLVSSAEQLTNILKDSSSKISRAVLNYALHILCSRHPTIVWSNSELFSLLINRNPHQMQQLVGSLDLENLRKVGAKLESMLQQTNPTKLPTLLPILRTVVQKTVAQTDREAMKEAFPNMVFALNQIAQNAAIPKHVQQLAKQITAVGFVGSQKQLTKQAKRERKLKAKEAELEMPKEFEESDEEEEEEEGPAKKKKKVALPIQKTKKYQAAVKRKGKDAPNPTNGRPKSKPRTKDSKWFAAGGAK